jgi:hypothetical protein
MTTTKQKAAQQQRANSRRQGRGGRGRGGTLQQRPQDGSERGV